MKIVVLVPFYNESRNLEAMESLIKNLNHNEINFKFIFCNDNSSDDTEVFLSKFLDSNSFDYEIITNSRNLGHGGSLISLSRLDLLESFDYVLTLDFDFSYLEEDLNSFFNFAEKNIILIGKRRFLDEGIFRQIITTASEFIIFLKTFSLFSDTNCPIRLYPSDLFIKTWKQIPEGILIPNIFSTFIIIKEQYSIKRIDINKNDLEQPDSITWGSNIFLKKYKLLKFSFISFKQLFKFKLN